MGRNPYPSGVANLSISPLSPHKSSIGPTHSSNFFEAPSTHSTTIPTSVALENSNLTIAELELGFDKPTLLPSQPASSDSPLSPKPLEPTSSFCFHLQNPSSTTSASLSFSKPSLSSITFHEGPSLHVGTSFSTSTNKPNLPFLVLIQKVTSPAPQISQTLPPSQLASFDSSLSPKPLEPTSPFCFHPQNSSSTTSASLSFSKPSLSFVTFHEGLSLHAGTSFSTSTNKPNLPFTGSDMEGYLSRPTIDLDFIAQPLDLTIFGDQPDESHQLPLYNLPSLPPDISPGVLASHPAETL